MCQGGIGATSETAMNILSPAKCDTDPSVNEGLIVYNVDIDLTCWIHKGRSTSKAYDA